MSVLENKSKIINSFNLLVRANPGTELVVLTQVFVPWIFLSILQSQS